MAWLTLPMEVEEFQNFISLVEKKELEDLKNLLYKPESDPPEKLDLYSPLFHCSNYDTRAPSYFQVKRNAEDDSFLEEIDNDDVKRCIRGKNSKILKHEVAWLLSHNPAFNVRDIVLEAAVRIGDPQLYEKTITGLATLVMSLYSPETLCMRHSYRSRHNQTKKLWEQIKQPKTTDIHAFCNAIIHPDINYKHYPLVTQEDTDDFVAHYATRSIHLKTRRLQSPTFSPPQRKKDDMFNEMHEVVAKMESPKRRKGDLDDYTRLLIKLASENSWDKEQELTDHVMTVINTSCNDWKSVMEMHVLLMIKGEELRIRRMSSRMSRTLHHLVYDSGKCAHDPCLVYGLCADAPRVLVSAVVWDVIEIAGFRREALGSRFIKRNHLLWAFYELGFGLPLETMGMFTYIEDEDRPPYHIYLSSMRLAKSLGNEIVQIQHFIFAVLYMEDNALVTDEMKREFTSFLRAAALSSLGRPDENVLLWM